ncbi:MAG TPA: GAF domain-containing protein, partial [Methylomirabilota bacterium]|nr:GAF domain-containing protein [Methylomirabilota bacterium]
MSTDAHLIAQVEALRHSLQEEKARSARLETSLAEIVEQQTVTGEILRVITSSPTDIQPILDTMAESAARLCQAQDGAIFRREGDGLLLVAHHGSIPFGPVGTASIPLSRGSVNGRSVLEARTIHVPDLSVQEDEYPEGSELARQWGHRTTLSVALMRDGSAIGTISLRRTDVRPFTDRQIALLQTFADQAVIALENARLFGELQTKNADLAESLEQQTATSEILRVISSSPTDVQPVFDAVADSAARLCEAFDAAIFRLEADRLRLVAHHGPIPYGRVGEFSIPASRGMVNGRAVLEGRPIQVGDLQNAVDEYPEGAETARQWSHRTMLAVPLTRDGVAIGSITLRRTEVHLFDERQIRLLQTFADQAVIAIENVRLFKELEARNNELRVALEQQTATSDILRVLSQSPTNTQPVFDTIADSVVRLCNGRLGGVYRFDGTLIHFVAHHNWTDEGLETARAIYPRPPSRDTQVAAAILDRTVVQVGDFETDVNVPPASVPLARALGYRSILVVPMLRDASPIGAIAVARSEPGEFSATHVELLRTFADQAVIAVENVRLFTELEARNGELRVALEQQTATSEVLKTISRTTFDLQPVLQTLIENATRLAGAEGGLLARLDGDVFRFLADYGTSPAFSEYWRQNVIRPGRGSLTGRAALEHRTIHVVDALADSEHTMLEAQAVAGYRSALSVPMLREDELVGVLFMYRTEVRPFTDKQIDLVATFADQAVIAIENARLLTELQTKNADLTETLEQQTATSEILRVISSSPTEAQPVFDAIVRSASRLCGGEHAIVTRYDGELLHLAAQHNPRPGAAEEAEGLFPQRPSPDASMSARALVEARLIHVPKVAHEALEPSVRAAHRRMHMEALVAVPMIFEGRPIGVVSVSRATPGPFSDRQIALLQTFADQAVIAIENVRLFKELESRNSELRVALEQQTATSELLKVIGRSTFDLQPVFDTLAANAVRLCEAEHGLVLRFDGEYLRAVAMYNASPELTEFLVKNPIRPSRGSSAARAGLERRAIQILDVQNEPGFTWGVREVEPIRTAMSVPMLRGNELLGVLSVNRHVVRPFTDGQIALMETFADQAVIAIENARLLAELQAKNASLTEALEQQTATSEILRVISQSPTDTQPVFDAIVASAARLCDATFSSVTQFDGAMLQLVAMNNMSPEETAAYHSLFPRVPGRHFILGRAFVDRRPVHVEDVGTDPDYDPQTLKVLQGAAPYRTYLGIPMLRDGVPIGSIGCGRREVKPFTATQVELVKTFADQAVIAIENVRLFKELESRNSELRVALEQQTATSELLKVIGRSTFDLQPVFETLADNALRLCAAEQAVIFRYDGQLLRPVVIRHFSRDDAAVVEQNPIALGRGSASGRAALERRAVHIHDVLADPEFTFLVGQLPFRTLLAIPMLRGDELLGVILIRRDEVRPFTDGQIALMETFADQAAIAIENAHLLTELQDKNASLTESLEQQTATAEILRVISSSPTEIRPVLDTIVASSVRLCDGKFGVVATFDGEMVQPTAFHNYSADALATVRRIYPMAPSRRHLLGRAILAREVVHVADVLEDAEYGAELRELAMAGGWHGGLAVPMLREGRPVGAIFVARAQAGVFSERQIELLRTFADQAVIAIQNVRLFTELDTRNNELRVALEQQTATSELLKV